MYKRINELLGTVYRSDEKIDWKRISKGYKLSEDFIEEFKDQVDWDIISTYQTLSESFIRKYKDHLDWKYISCFQILSEDFMEEHKDWLDWYWVSFNQELSEPFIEKYWKKVSCLGISISQILSPGFMEKYKDYLSWGNISLYQPYISANGLTIPTQNTLYWLYQETKEQGWFISYAWKDFKGIYKFINLNEVNRGGGTDPVYVDFLKIKVYWKDLKLVSSVRKCEVIRNIKCI